ncbi:serine/threonine protein kinase Ran1 [Lathyrus oleraceus]|uniref:Serine/threonine protein kinase Ran1 n=1 Tax=Pisum sativum TaxID=3888 RepID=A0A9D4W9X7_PEA|nr:serine/threonine protein kinase Ran1 [Pisum sativum]
MGGSKASSTSEVGNGLPRCGCNETMKLLVSKSIENPGRKFWKCRNYMVGNRKLLVESGINISTEVESFVVELEESAKTGILVACDGILIGVLGVADSLKREASVVIEGLKKMGITPVYGRAEVMPAGKADVVRSFQKDGSIVAMVGDVQNPNFLRGGKMVTPHPNPNKEPSLGGSTVMPQRIDVDSGIVYAVSTAHNGPILTPRHPDTPRPVMMGTSGK